MGNKTKILEENSDEETKKAVIVAIEKCGQGINGKERVKFLNILFDTKETQIIVPRLELLEISAKKLLEILDNERVFELISLMLERPVLFRFQIGVLLSFFRRNELPEILLKEINPKKIDENLTVEMGYRGWYLCNEAESRMRISIKDKAVILLNKHLLVKFNGRLSALCIRSFSSVGRGIFYEGNWYSSTDNDSREIIKNAFDDGKRTHIDLLSGNWAIMRSLNDYGGNNSQKYLEKIRQFESTLSEFLPKSINGMIKKDYRSKSELEGDIVNPS